MEFRPVPFSLSWLSGHVSQLMTITGTSVTAAGSPHNFQRLSGRKRFSSSPGKKRFHQKPEPLLSLRCTPKGQVLLETVSVAQGGCAAPGLSLRLPVPREPGVERPVSQVWGRRLAVSKETRIEETPQPQVATADPKEQGGSRQVRAVAGRSGPWQAGQGRSRQAGQGRGRQVRAVAG